MSDESALLAAIHANPDDDTPRLAYADWLDENGDEARAEFIRVQIEQARLAEEGEERRDTLRDRERELLAAHLEVWAANAGAVEGKNTKVGFRRGFVEIVSLYDSAVSDLDLVSRIPGLRSLTVGRIALIPAAVQLLASLDLNSLTIYDTPFPREWLELLEPLPCGTVLDISPKDGAFDRDVWNEFQSRRIGRLANLTPRERHAEARRWQRGHYESRIYTHGMRSVSVQDVRACDTEMQLLAELQDVQEVRIADSDLTAAGLDYIARLPKLRSLDLSWVPVESIAPLARCTALETLRVWPEHPHVIGEAGTEGLDHLVNLRELLLRYQYGKQTLSRLGALPKLRTLDIELEPIAGEEAFAPLSHLTALEKLIIGEGAVPGGSLRFLAPLRRLKMLSIQVSIGCAEDFRSLGALTELSELHLEGGSVTDSAIQHLASLKNLRTLKSQDTLVTPAGARWLADQLPDVTVVLDEHAIMSPRRTVRLRRRVVDEVISALLPSDWYFRGRSTAEPCSQLVEAGWKNIYGTTGDTVGPAGIRLYVSEEPNPATAINALAEWSGQDVQSKIDEHDVVDLGGRGESCVYGYGRQRHLLVVVASGGNCAVLDCGVSVSRFEEFRPLFLFVAKSLRVGADALVGVGEEITVPVSGL